MGSVSGSLEALAAVAELEPEVIVPGHGVPGGMETVNACGSYLRWLQQNAEEAFAAGLSPLEAARELDLGEFAEPPRSRAPGGQPSPRLLPSFRGARPGEPIDLRAAFADMINLERRQPSAAWPRAPKCKGTSPRLRARPRRSAMTTSCGARMGTCVSDNLADGKPAVLVASPVSATIVAPPQIADQGVETK